MSLVELDRSSTKAPGTQPAVELRRVTMRYKPGVDVLRNIDVTLQETEFLAIVGPSGCGKSTILKLIAGLAAVSSGKLSVRGEVHAQTPPGIGFMFQRDTLLPWATVAQNITLGLECRGNPPSENRAEVERLLRLLGLSGYGHYYPRALSGGMRQRAALGRLLAYAPDIYLMDEPFGALDAQTKLQMGAELLRIWSSDRKSVIFVTHDIEEAVSLADRVIVMSGRPGTIKSDYAIDLERPRDLLAVRRDPKFYGYVERIWADILG